MAVQIQGNGGTIAEVETNTRALRVALRPFDFGALGNYCMSLQTGVMAAGLAANSEIFQARWTDATRLALVESLECDGAGNAGTAFAAGVTMLQAFIARAWTVDGSGGAPAFLTGNNNKLRTSMGTMLMGAIRMATTAALTAGTKTLDSQAFGQVFGAVPATAGAVVLPPSRMFRSLTDDAYPCVLATNEGVVVRATVPATGTWTGGVTFRWVEAAAY